MSDFIGRRLAQTLKAMSLDELKRAINQGRKELLFLISHKPDNLEGEIELIDETLKVIKQEIEKREAGNEK